MDEKPRTRKVPPNGGWGWMIVIGSALNGLATIPILQAFGLIFKDIFPKYGFNGTQTTVLINVNLAFGMVLGLMNGPLLECFGYRTVATVGSLIYAVGVTLTAFANTFPLLMLSYGILASLGMGVTMSAFSFAVNSYFTTKRGRAVALGLTITGLGPIIMPHVTSILTSHYGCQGTMLLYGAFSLHSFIGASLLQPLKWHLKDEPIAEMEPLREVCNEVEKDNPETNKGGVDNATRATRFQRQRKMTTTSLNRDPDATSIYEFDIPLPRQHSFTTAAMDKRNDVEMVLQRLRNSEFSSEYMSDSAKDKNYLYESVETIHLGSSFRIFDDVYTEPMTKYYSLSSLNQQRFRQEEKELPLNEKNSKNPNEGCEDRFSGLTVMKRIVRFYDLELLRDPVYVNILIGMAIAIFAEVNFSLLTPFILADLGMSTERIATAMSLLACVDLASRMTAPFLGEWLHQPPRIMYLISLVLLILSRTSLLFVRGFSGVLIVAVGLGAAKGIRSVYMNLVVPCYVPIQRLPYASGIQMVANGIVLISAGPILGLIRDETGSYEPCIIVMNCVTLVTIALWLIELFIVRRTNK